ncbi:carbohydrate ABC transporter permease [Paenibacillus sp.]|uniref:carbohydrate ABC transporter permease n=1 Tax=Paenibacillus sp. TaxID=58172 RepID=UPI002D548CF7|nr:carbohydrate ABC transporter permease [Paenibacillus sp.]HZG87455.1 carbohydrate ABC transporter permease [Paenibacillus sp.]
MKTSLPLKLTSHLFLMLGALTMITPFLWTIGTSLKQLQEVFVFPPTLFGERLVWDNYLRIADRFPFDVYVLNSFKITVIVVAAQLVTSSMAGFAFARLRFPFRDALFAAYLATMMIPIQVTLIPNFIIMRHYNLIDTHWSLILPALVSAFGTFLLRQFFLTIPAELEEAAKMDGCTPFGIYWRIFVPLSKPAMATLGVFVFMGMWNEFMAPLIYINSQSKMTLPLGLASMQGLYGTDWPVLMASTVLSIAPLIVIFLLAQDFFIKGVTLSGLKG